MKIISNTIEVFKTYKYSDKLLSVLAFAVFLLMIVKMIVFPFGVFGFGQNGIYTTGLVSTTGVQNLNPLFVDYNEADREISRLIFSGLVTYNPLKKAVVDDMAHLTVSEDKKNYIFILRDGLKWQDGQPITIDDVYFTFHDLIMNPEFSNNILRTNFAGVKVVKIDNRTIKFSLDKPNVFFVSNFLVGILPQHILKNVAPADILQNDFNKKPIGSGPYMITDPIEAFADGRNQVTLEKNPNYYGEKPSIQMMRFIVYPTMQALLDQVDGVNSVVKVSGDNVMDFIRNKRFKLIPYELPQYTAVFMNMEGALLKSKDIRLALEKSLNKAAFIGDSLDKISIETPILELKQKDWAYKFDVDFSNKTLKSLGYKYKSDDVDMKGFRYDKAGNSLQLNLIARLYDEGTYQFNETQKEVDFLVNSWKAVGFDIKVEFLPLETFSNKISKRDYDLLVVGQNLGYNPDTYSFWHSTQAGPLGQNLSNYKSFKVDNIIEDVRSTFDQGARDLKLKELATQLKDDVPAIFLYRPIYYYALDTKVSGISMDGVVFPSDGFENIYTWKFQK